MTLVPDVNWPPSRASRRNRICTPCFSKKTREWEAKNREKHLEARNRRNRKLNATNKRKDYYRGRARAAREAAGCTAYSRDKAGWIYGICNPAWPGYVKVGYARNLDERLRQYQTGSPHRDYSVVVAAKVADRVASECQLLAELRGLRVGRTEWFTLHPDDLRQHLIRLTKQEQRQ